VDVVVAAEAPRPACIACVQGPRTRLLTMHRRTAPVLELQRLLRLQFQRSAAARPLPPPPSRRASGPGCSWNRPPSGRSGNYDRSRRRLLPQRRLLHRWQVLRCSKTQCNRLSSRYTWSRPTHGRLRTSRLRPEAWPHSRAHAAAHGPGPWPTAARCITTAARCKAPVCSRKSRMQHSDAAAAAAHLQPAGTDFVPDTPPGDVDGATSCSSGMACNPSGSCSIMLIILQTQASPVTGVIHWCR
jgi:hypothetical protein